MANRAALEKEIKEYCNLNNIQDVAGFITQCMLKGFNIVKYGLSPQDNIKREKNEIETVPVNRTVKKEENKQEQEQITIKRRKIKVISND